MYASKPNIPAPTTAPMPIPAFAPVESSEVAFCAGAMMSLGDGLGVSLFGEEMLVGERDGERD